ncbi:alginate lyase family protein [Streptomyces sp. NBC_01304]|uniref:alginate lyase family protein n=1 Tax=Streptomyces sp. NBC_01304 TaxID=2903818 RepID=UPI002E127205|nr:alginate lyase family protein [Streptomyces sp. NBC_01304]
MSRPHAAVRRTLAAALLAPLLTALGPVSEVASVPRRPARAPTASRAWEVPPLAAPAESPSTSGPSTGPSGRPAESTHRLQTPVAPQRAQGQPSGLTTPLPTQALGPTAPAPQPKPLRHPGALVSRAQLDTVRKQVKAGKEPWASAFDGMRASRYASLWYYPQPQTEVSCPSGNRPGRGCQQEREDAIAAYTHALMWTVTRDEKYAKKALEIMDLWSATLKNHTEANSGLQSAWAGSMWARAAEIMRYVYKGWSADGITRFDRFLREIYLPQVAGGSLGRNGNWDLVMADAAASIGVFLDDRSVLERAVARVRNRVPAYFYVHGDGPRPKAPPGALLDAPAELTRYWFGQRRLVDGLAQETCRNFEHVGYALAATAHVAETAHHQGIDLWREIGPRLRPALELHADYQLRDAETAPDWLCGGHITPTLGPDLEVALNHLQNRMGGRLPKARRLAGEQRPAGTDNLFVAWETLTHGENP